MFTDKKVTPGKKLYHVSYTVKPYEVIEKLRYCDDIHRMDISEDTDVGFAMYSGSYTKEEFYEIHDSVPVSVIRYSVQFYDGVRMVISENRTTVFTEDPNFDIEAYLNEKSKKR